MVLSGPTILRPQVQIPSTPSSIFSICIIEIVIDIGIRKRTKINAQEAGIYSLIDICDFHDGHPLECKHICLVEKKVTTAIFCPIDVRTFLRV